MRQAGEALFGWTGAAFRAIVTDDDGHMQVDALSSALPAGAATSDNQTNGDQKARAMGVEGANQRQILVDVNGRLLVAQPTAADLKMTEASAASILAKLSSDPATQTTSAAILAKLSADPATQTTLAAVLAKLSADPATQTTLAAILAKLTADPATQTTLAAVLGQLDNKTSTLATQTTLADLLTELRAHRTPIRKAFSAVAVADGGEVEITGLTAGRSYELRCFRCTPHTGGGAATHRTHRLYEATGGAAADLAWEDPASLAVADGESVPYNPGPIMVADGAGKLWLRYTVVGGGTITETGKIDLLPFYS
jgi:arginine repressor